MRIAEINATNYLSHRALALAVAPDTRVLFIAGPNGAGKSAVAQAIRLALTGDPVRGLEAKNQLVQLIRQGESSGNVSVTLVDPSAGVNQGGEYVYSVNLKSGTRTAKSVGEDNAPTIPALALDPAEFLRLDAKSRQKEMFRLAGVKMSMEAITKALGERGHAPERVERACKYLRLGFDAASKEARDAATEARGAWKSITGESYGDVKAETWRAPLPERSVEGSFDEVKTAAAAARQAVTETSEKLHKLQAAEESTRGAEKMRQLVADLDANKSRATIIDTEAKELADKADALGRKAAYHGGTTEPCPACGVVLARDGNGRLIESKTVPHSMEEMKAAKAEHEQAKTALRDANSRLAAVRTAVAEGEAARKLLADLPKRPSDEDMEAAKRANNVAQATLAQAQSDLDLAERAERQREEADQRTEAAKLAHRDVGAYVALAEGIDALPGEFLSGVVTTVNGLLAEAAAAFDQPIIVGADMAPMYGTIPYALASESQQWRIRAALGYAIAELSKVGILVLDQFDVLEPRARGPVLKFLATQTRAQVVLLGTLKEKPNLPKPFAVEWLG